MSQKKKHVKQQEEKQQKLEAEEIQVQAEDEAVLETDSWEEEKAALEGKISELEAAFAELQDNYLRKQADFDNFRKRMIRDKEDAIRYANKDLLQDVIPVIDDFERAISSAEESKDFSSFYEGIKLIEKQFAGMLEKKWGLKRMNSLHEEFDPQQHEALMMEERDDVDTQRVIEDFQRGYFYHDKVLRHAKVKVAVPAEKA